MTNNRLSFPVVPGALKEKYGVDSPVIRPPGLSEADLEIDFRQPLRPLLVTQLLRNYTEIADGGKPDEAFFWDLNVGTRIEGLAVIALSGTGSNLELQLRCAWETCGEQMEMSLSMQEIAVMNSQSGAKKTGDGVFAIPIHQEEYFFRKPTGRDQREWLYSSFPDEETALQAMIDRLWVKGDIVPSLPRDAQWLAAVDDGMREIDPLVHLELTVFCPACNHRNVYALDLEDLLLQRLKKIQRDLLQTVHCLASRYHWSEQQVFAVSPRRRSDYLALIEEDPR